MGVNGGGLIPCRPCATFIAAPPEAPIEVVLALRVAPRTEVQVEETLVCGGR